MVGGGKISQPEVANDPIVKYMLKVREEHASGQEKDYSHVFRSKSRFDFIRLSCIVVGIELAYAAETAFVSPILLQIGIEHRHMTMVWGLSPLLGFFLAPLLGSLSDRCRSKLGRRRPVIIILSIGILFGLILVPFGKDLGLLLGDLGYVAVNETGILFNTTEPSILIDTLDNDESSMMKSYKFAIILTILGTIMLDFDADTCQTPARAYLLDVCVPDDHAKALSTFTIMAGLGGTVGYALGAIDWKKTQIGSFLGGNIPTVFIIVTIIFCLCFLITITSFREIPLSLIEKDELMRPLSAAAIKKEILKNNNPVYYIKETTTLELRMSENNNKSENDNNQQTNNEKYSKIENGEFGTIVNGIGKNIPIININNNNNNRNNGISIAHDNIDDEEERISLAQYLKSIFIMPKSMRILSLTNLLTWMAHVCYCLYFTDFVGEAVFGGDPTAIPHSKESDLYEEGVRFGCWGLSIYAFSCSMYSITIEKLMKKFGTKYVYVGGILIYAVGMLVLAIWPTKAGVLSLSITAGIIYATLFTIPYFLVAKYHSRGCFKVKSGENVPLKYIRGLGTDIAIISSMVFIAQLIVSLSVGPFIAWLNTTAAVLYAASGLSICAAISAMFVLYLD